MADYKPQFGWLGHEREKKAFAEVMQRDHPPFVMFDDFVAKESRPAKDYPTPPGFDGGWEFWTGVEKCYGKQVAPGPQDVGDCVGYSTVLSATDLIAHEVYWEGQNEKFFIPTVLFSYGAGRVYIGGGRLGNSDGSLGSWQIAADTEYGFLPSDLPGLPFKPDEPCEPEGRIVKQWGSQKSILDQWKDKAAPFRLGEGTKIESSDQLKKVVCELHRPVTIASDWGFAKAGLDSATGLVLWRRSGSWGHQMHIRGVIEIKGRWFAYIGNQWGTTFHGDPGKGPTGGFWVPFEIMDQWVRDAEVYARGLFPGRPADKPDFGWR